MKIIPYTPELKPYFESINRAWIEEYFTMEPHDTYVLQNPEEAILKDGGCIFFIEHGDDIIGTAALQKVDDKTFELSKMGVDKQARGLGAGVLLVKEAMRIATEELHAGTLILYSNRKLKPAITLYEKMGFEETPLEEGQYKAGTGRRFVRANIKMSMQLNVARF